jgi:hypothetical protein
MALEYVWAASTAMVNGFKINFGDTWYKYDPIVLANPSLFTDDPRPGLRATSPISEADREDRIEQATAGPGEKRNVRRA